MMQRSLVVVLSLTGLLYCSGAVGVSAEISAWSGLRYDLFTDNHSPETVGFEATCPFGVSYRRDLLTLTLKTAVSSANLYPGNEREAKIASLTDTTLSAAYGFANLPVGVTLGVEVNLPTGKERLTSAQKPAEAGENNDLFEIDDFGEGFNLGLNVGFSKEFGTIGLNLNGQYTFNGAYDPTADIPNDTFNPGDHGQFSAVFNWKASSSVTVDTAATYSIFTPDQVRDRETFQEGAKLVIGANLRLVMQMLRPLRIVTGVKVAVQAKNKEIRVDNTLRAEPENSNGSEFFGLCDVMYETSPRLAWRMSSDLRYYDESDRKDVVPYRGKRLRYAIGPGFIYAPDRRIAINGLLKYFVLQHEQDIWLARDTTYQGVNVSVGVSYTR